jgi:hypothetical protein
VPLALQLGSSSSFGLHLMIEDILGSLDGLGSSWKIRQSSRRQGLLGNGAVMYVQWFCPGKKKNRMGSRRQRF